MNLSLSGATNFVKAKVKTPGINVFIPKLLCYHIHEKSINKLFTASVGPDEENCALGLENVPRLSGSGRFQDLGHIFSHTVNLIIKLDGGWQDILVSNFSKTKIVWENF